MFLIKSVRCQSTRKSQIILGFAVVAGMMTFSTQASYASPGCDFLNNGGANITSTNTAGGINTIGANRLFATGESITSTLSGTVTNSFGQIGPQIFFNGNTTGSATHVVPSDGTFLIESDVATIGGTGSIGWTCTEPGAPASTGSGSGSSSGSSGSTITPPGTGDTQQGSAEHTARQVGAVIAGVGKRDLPIPEDFDDGDDLFNPIVDVEERNRRLQRKNTRKQIEGEIDSLQRHSTELQTEIENAKFLLDEFKAARKDEGYIYRQNQNDASYRLLKRRLRQISVNEGIWTEILAGKKKELAGIPAKIKLAKARLVEFDRLVAASSNYVSSTPSNKPLSRFNLSGSKFGLVGSARSYALNTPIPVIFFANGNVTFLNGAGDGEIGTGQFGVAAQVQKNIVIGAYALGVVGNTKRTDAIASTDTDTQGFGGGIYSRYILGNQINGSLSLNYVKTDNDVTITTATAPVATGSYDGKIFTANGGFSRTFDVDGFLITPSIGATYISRRTSAYTDSNSTAVGSTNRNEFSGDLGVRFTRSFAITDSPIAIITPWASTDTRINISDNGGVVSAGQLVFGQDDARYTLGLGVNIGFVNGAKLNLNSSFNDLGSDTESITVGLKLIVPLN